MQKVIRQICDSIKAGHFVNENSISQGIVLPVLQNLGWPIFNPAIVTPEYTVGKGRVDFALRDMNGKPRIFLEVKMFGKADATGNRQLFEYAFHQGVPMAVLTDGRMWSFYFPGGEGSYKDRCLAQVDLPGGSAGKAVDIFRRYMSHDNALSEGFLTIIQNDYQKEIHHRMVKETLPKAWIQFISNPHKAFVDSIMAKTESICQVRPDYDECVKFIKSTGAQIETAPVVEPVALPSDPRPSRSYSFTYHEKTHSAKTLWEITKQVLLLFDQKDAHFLDNLSRQVRGPKRSLIAQSKEEIYPDPPEGMSKYCVELCPGWWMGTSYDKARFTAHIKTACDVAGIEFGKDLTLSF